jgi:uncharacterized membrane protein
MIGHALLLPTADHGTTRVAAWVQLILPITANAHQLTWCRIHKMGI